MCVILGVSKITPAYLIRAESGMETVSGLNYVRVINYWCSRNQLMKDRFPDMFLEKQRSNSLGNFSLQNFQNYYPDILDSLYRH